MAKPKVSAPEVGLQAPELVVQRGNFGPVLGGAFSGDGMLATLDRGGNVRLWNALSGELVRVLSTHGEGGLCASFSPDNRSVAVGGFRGQVMIFDASTGALLHGWPSHKDRVWSVSFSGDGQLLASVGDDGLICLRDTARGVLLRTFANAPKKGEGENPFVMVRFSPAGTMFAVDERGVLSRYDAATGALQKQWPRASRVFAVSPDGELVASALAQENDEMMGSSKKESQVRVWNAQSGQLLFVLSVKAPVSSLAFSADGLLLGASGQAHGQLQSGEKTTPAPILGWSMKSGEVVKKWLDSGGDVRELVTIPGAVRAQGRAENELFASISERDGGVRLWNLSGARLMAAQPRSSVFFRCSGQVSALWPSRPMELPSRSRMRRASRFGMGAR